MIEAGKNEYPRFVDWHVGWHTDQEEKHAHTRKKKEKTKGSKLLSFEAQERWRANYGTFALSVLTFFLILFLFYLLLSTYVLSFFRCAIIIFLLRQLRRQIFFFWTFLFLFTWSRRAAYVRVKSSSRLREKKTKTKYMMGKKNSKEDRCYSPVIGEKHKRTYLNSSVIPSGLFQSSNHILLFSKLFIYIYIYFKHRSYFRKALTP